MEKETMTMSNSTLINHTKISPNSTNPRTNTIKKITIHHMAGNLTVETCGNVFANSSAQASANYGIGSDGRVGLYVDEKNRSWASSSPANDHQAVTIEVANSSTGGDWPVNDTAYAKLIDLCVDICQRNGISSLKWTGDSNGTLTCHYMFAATACPGPYLKSKMAEIAAAVNARLGGSTDNNTTASTSTVSTGTSTPAASAAPNADINKAGVLSFQSWLNSNYLSGLTTDGIFGAKTKTAAIKAFQQNRKVVIDGIWGPKTAAASPTLSLNATGNPVYILQGMLYCRKYSYSGFDGIYGAMTVAEVKSYQSANGLTADGIAGPLTFTSLFAK